VRASKLKSVGNIELNGIAKSPFVVLPGPKVNNDSVTDVVQGWEADAQIEAGIHQPVFPSQLLQFGGPV
jgi:hypothetical protein